MPKPVKQPPAVKSHQRAGRSWVSRFLGVLNAAFKAAIRNADKTVFPIALLLIVVAFLAVQNRIDSNDPKLALAPVFADPDIDFQPAPNRD